MFTGLVREVGTVESLERTEAGARLRVGAGLAAGLSEGDSISVAGACLTVAACGDGSFAADVMNQTLSLTTLGELGPAEPVNLEPAVRAGEPLGGHLVQGHVDATGTVAAITEDGFSRRVRIATPAELHRYLAEHGSIAVAGVSLTISGLADDGFEVALIPETIERTTLGGLERGDGVNLEVDLIARYAERLVQGLPNRERSPDA
ncbi:MAG: riboflavin synthase [Solirubrobacterales bacterium]